MTELTGPGNCAECGTALPVEAIMSGDGGPLAVDIRGHRIEIPGLYVCTPCAGAIMVGERESGVSLEAIVAFFEGNFGPRLVGAVMTADDRQMADMCAQRLAEVMELQSLLEAVIQLQGEPGGLDFIPVCEGKCGKPHPRDMAHLN